MATFQGKIRTRTNQIRSVEIRGPDKADARKQAARMGRVVTFKRTYRASMGGKMTAGDRQMFFTRLASMLGSRVGTSDALMLLRDTFGGKISEVSGRLLNYVQSGDDLAGAFAKVGQPDFPDATIALIQAGSRSGDTYRALQDARMFEWELNNVKKGAAKGLYTGVFSFLMAGGMVIASTLYIGPKIMESDLIKASNKKGDVNIDWINTVGYVTGYLMAVLLAIGFLMWGLSFLGRRIAPVTVDRVIMKIPYYKDLVLSRNNFIVLYGLALLVKSGVRTEEALNLSAQGAPRGALKADLIAARDAVKTGRQWPKVMNTLHPTDKAALMSATDREQVAHTLDTLATQYRELYAQRLASFVPILNLAAALFMSIAGGLLFGQSILPMLMASSALLG
jgi:general secretion pathway protein F